MAREYSLRLDKYGIPKELYNELLWFCRQYPRKVAELNSIYGGFNCFAIDGQPRGNVTGNPTEARAMRAMQLQKDIGDIEQAARKADAELCSYIIRHVTDRVNFEVLCAPCGINQFYAARRRFFWHLAHR